MSWLSSLTGIHIAVEKPLTSIANAIIPGSGTLAAGAGNLLGKVVSPGVQNTTTTQPLTTVSATTALGGGTSPSQGPTGTSGTPAWLVPVAIVAAVAVALWLALRR